MPSASRRAVQLLVCTTGTNSDHDGTISCRVRGRPQQGKGLEVPCNYVLHVSGKKKLNYKSTLRISKGDYAINVCVVQCYILACIAV